MKTILSTLALAFYFSFAFSQVMVDQTIQLNEIPNMFLGAEYEISNITFSGDPDQLGIVFGNSSNLGMDLGLIMGTGNVNVITSDGAGGNNSSGSSDGGGNFGFGDTDLSAITGFDSHDAAVLEFDFIATSDMMSFEYIFASEEYPEWTCTSFNDVFGFFLSGPGIAGEFQNNAINIATIPDSNPAAYVSIDNINDNTCGETYVDYYVSNAEMNPEPSIIAFDGFTVILPAEIAVIPGETYHLKLAIADTGDTVMDSAVAIRSSTSVFIWSESEDEIDEGGMALLNETQLIEGCTDGEFDIYISYPTASLITDISLSGTAVMGEDFEDVSDLLQIPNDFVGIHTIPITAIGDSDAEGEETIILSLTYEDEFGELVTVTEEMSIMDGNEELSLDLESDYTLCNAEQIEIDATTSTGTGDITYEWSDGETGATHEFGPYQLGEQTVTLTDECENTFTHEFTIELAEELELIENTTICTEEYSLEIVQAGEAPFTYTYDETLVSEENGMFGSNFEGEYTIQVEDNCGATNELLLTVVECTSVDEVSGIEFLILNSEEQLLINTDNIGEFNIELFDSSGKLVISERMNSTSHPISKSSLKAGMYTIRISSNSKLISTQKVIR